MIPLWNFNSKALDHEALRGSGTDKHHRILQTPSTQVSAVMNTLLAYQSMKILVPNKT